MSEPGADRSVDGSAATGSESAELAAEDEKWPVGFILTIVMVSLYLAYRIIQGFVLFFQWIF